MAPIQLRAATVADARAIAEIKIAARRVAYRGIVPDAVLDELETDDVRRNWLGVSEAELPRFGVVATEEDALVGYALFGPSHNAVGIHSGQIFEIYVLPPKFGGGLAACLLQEALARLRADGHHDVFLWVFAANARARRFYEKHGATLIAGAALITEIGGARLPEVAYGFRLPETLK